MSERPDETARRALSIAAALAAAGPGEKADARRMGDDGAPVFWRQASRLGISRPQEQDWLRFTRLIALLTPASATASIHDQARSLGAVLADAGFSEIRVARLLATRGDPRAEALERAIRTIAPKRPHFSVVGLARIVLGRGGNDLARDYYNRLDHTRTPETADE